MIVKKNKNTNKMNLVISQRAKNLKLKQNLSQFQQMKLKRMTPIKMKVIKMKVIKMKVVKMKVIKMKVVKMKVIKMKVVKMKDIKMKVIKMKDIKMRDIKMRENMVMIIKKMKSNKKNKRLNHKKEEMIQSGNGLLIVMVQS
jgi:hypothetical protein